MIRERRPPGGGLEGHEIKAIGFGLYTWGLVSAGVLILGGLGGMHWWQLLLAIFVVAPTLGALVGIVSLMGAEHAGRAAQMIYAPTGASTPYVPGFSEQQAMAMRGDVPAALRSFEDLIAGAPDDPHVRLAAAEMYATKARDPVRAAELYRQARALPAATRAHEMAATNALIDLYRGALADPGRMRTELRRLADRFAGTAPGEMAGMALASLREQEGREAGSGKREAGTGKKEEE